MTHDEMIAVIQAKKDGKRIRIKSKFGQTWTDFLGHLFDFTEYDYEVKPEPMEMLVVMSEKGKPMVCALLEDADGLEKPSNCRTVKFREVLDE